MISLDTEAELKTLWILIFDAMVWFRYLISFSDLPALVNFSMASTVKPAVTATSIKRDPPLSGHFRAPRVILNANAPLLSVYLSNPASGRRNSP